jgi:Tfp pilus assembly protein FimT
MPARIPILKSWSGLTSQSMTENRLRSGFSTVELAIVLALILVMTVVSLPVALNTIRTYRRDAAARHVLWQIRSTQSFATSRNAVIGFQWGPDASRATDTYRVVRDATKSCGLPSAAAAVDGTNVIEGWFDLGEAFPGLTIQSIRDASNASVGGVMFNPIGASVNTCATVSFPVDLVVADQAGRSRTIRISASGSTRLR